MTALDTRLDELFDELVPANGKCDTVAGEIVRAISRIAYRYWNDGDRLGVGYGKETCNPAGRYLAAKCGGKVEKAVRSLWGVEWDDLYERGVELLKEVVLEHLDKHPELKTMPNTEDMWDYRNKDEDVDTSYDDDEDDYYEEDEDYE